jgi:hypothetical protein
MSYLAPEWANSTSLTFRLRKRKGFLALIRSRHSTASLFIAARLKAGDRGRLSGQQGAPSLAAVIRCAKEEDSALNVKRAPPSPWGDRA